MGGLDCQKAFMEKNSIVCSFLNSSISNFPSLKTTFFKSCQLQFIKIILLPYVVFWWYPNLYTRVHLYFMSHSHHPWPQVPFFSIQHSLRCWWNFLIASNSMPHKYFRSCFSTCFITIDLTFSPKWTFEIHLVFDNKVLSPKWSS
jgi:hypothetical protein